MSKSVSKRKKRPAPQQRQPTPPPVPQARLTAMRDSFVNTLARTGMTDNLVSASEYPLTRLTNDYNLMTSLYRNDWIAHRIINTPAEDMCKNWYTLNSAPSPEHAKRYKYEEQRTNVRAKVLSGLKWSRLYGGAAGLMMIRGQEDLSQPLDIDNIMPGDFRGIQVVDRWNGINPSMELVDDPNDDEFGMPMYYEFQMPNAAKENIVRVHHSRILRFIGRELPYVEQVAENYWGMSELEHVFEELNKRNNTSANIAQLVFQANLRVLQIKDFDQYLAMTSAREQRDLYQTLEAQNRLMSNMGIQVVSDGETFNNYQYTFTGVADVYELFMSDVAGAAEIPATKLFGRSPSGMNATGESDLRNYYDSIKQKQESSLRPVLNKLVPVLCMSAWGEIPDYIDFTFAPIREMSEEERSVLVYRNTEAINKAYLAGLIPQRTALQELRKMGQTTGVFTSITDEEIAQADNKIRSAEEIAARYPQTIQGAENFSHPEVTEPGGEKVEGTGQRFNDGLLPFLLLKEG